MLDGRPDARKLVLNMIVKKCAGAVPVNHRKGAVRGGGEGLALISRLHHVVGGMLDVNVPLEDSHLVTHEPDRYPHIEQSHGDNRVLNHASDAVFDGDWEGGTRVFRSSCAPLDVVDHPLKFQPSTLILGKLEPLLCICASVGRQHDPSVPNARRCSPQRRNLLSLVLGRL